MAVRSVGEHSPSSTREAILEAARRRLVAGEDLAVAAVAAEAGVTRQTVHAHFGGARGLLAQLANEGLAIPAPDEPTRQRLIDAAVRILSQPGGGLASIEAIAAEAGLTKGAFYHHFADRGELLRAVARCVSPVGELAARLEPAMDAPAREGLIAIAGAYYEMIRSRTDLIRNLATNAARDPELTAVVMNEIVGQGAPLIFAWYALQVERGELRPVDPSFVTQMIFGPAFMLVIMGPEVLEQMSRHGVHLAIDNVEAYVDLALGGIAAAPVQSATREPGGR